MEIVLDLPLPPSLNMAYSTVGRRRVKSKAYKVWLNDADGHLFLGINAYRTLRDRLKGPYSLHIAVPQAMRGDASNRIKLVEDYLVSQEITPDDRYCQKATAERDPSVPKGMCRVTVRTTSSRELQSTEK